VLSALTLYRGWVIVHNQLPLFFDEAQYWVWSLKPDWGYYSKPPMVAWVIRLFSGMGNSELAVRLGTLLLHPLTAVLVYLLGRRMFNATTALFAAILFISLPLVGFNSLFMTTDAPLFFFWGAATYFLWRALERNTWTEWLLAGAAAGLGLLSKYSMVFYALSVAVVLCLPAYRSHWFNPRLYLAALLALLIFSPNLWWNAQMDFVSFRHTAEISQLDRNLLHPPKLAEFFVGQFGCMGPIGFSFLLIALASPSVWRDPKLGFLAAMTLPFLAMISLQALLAKANVNWAAPAYFAGALLVTAGWMDRFRAPWWLSAVLINLVLLSCFYHYHALAASLGVRLTRASDPYARVLGWPELASAIRPRLSEHPDALLAVEDRREYALLSYYLRLQPERIRIWNPDNEKKNHFHLVADMERNIGADFILATGSPLGERAANSFERWTPVGTARVQVYPDYTLTLYLYRGDQFKGYQP
jgi:4-amino-4-deoxy-L-arabinose transferase-like glycosyltransferase